MSGASYATILRIQQNICNHFLARASNHVKRNTVFIVELEVKTRIYSCYRTPLERSSKDFL